MKKFLGLLLIGCMGLSSCSLNKQAKSMKALQQCQFELLAVDSLTLGGSNILPLLERGELDVQSLPGVVMALFTEQLPLHTKLQLKVKNPSRSTAGMQAFAYQVLLDGKSILEGNSDLPFSVKGGHTDTVAVRLQANAFKLIKERDSRDKIVRLIEEVRQGSNSTAESATRVLLTLKIKPSIGLGNQSMDYPGYIALEKMVDKNTINRFLKSSGSIR